MLYKTQVGDLTKHTKTLCSLLKIKWFIADILSKVPNLTNNYWLPVMLVIATVSYFFRSE